MHNLLKPTVALLALFAVQSQVVAEGPPMSNGIISNPALVANQSIAKAQAAGAISTFMSKGAQECDDKGQHCHSVFGAEDTPDYAGLQRTVQSATGVQSFNFMDKDGGSAAYQAQTGTLAVACGSTKTQMVAGIAVKVMDCHVNSTGDSQVTFKVCTAPSRGLPVSPPANAVPCSPDPLSPSYVPPPGKVCAAAACDTEPVGSLNGWSADQTVSWTATLPSNATDDVKARNGLAMVFYPALDGSITPDFKADSDNLTAVKVVQSFINNQNHKTAVGLRIAYRHKATVTKDMMVAGPGSVPNPQDHTNQWATLQKLQGNALIPKYGAKYAKNGSECLQQINHGVASDGLISVCDQTYTNESGIKPLAKTARVAAEGQDCGTSEICVQKVVNTNTWKETCRTDVPLSMRKCTTTTDYTMNNITSTRSKPTEICEEKRATFQASCVSQSTLDSVTPGCTAGDPNCLRVRSCNLGQAYNLYLPDAGGMGEDGCYGGDGLWTAYICSDDDVPYIRFNTNSTTDVARNLRPGETAIVSISGSSCYAKYTNNVSCSMGQCSGRVAMTLGKMVSTPTETGCTEVCTGFFNCTWQKPAGACTTNEFGETTCPMTACAVSTSFNAQSFGGAVQIAGTATFSMANLYTVNLSQSTTCSQYEAASN